MKTKLCCLLGVVGTLGMLVPLYGQGADRGGVARPVGSQAANLVTGPSGRLNSVVAGVGPTMRIRLTPVPSQGLGSYPPGSFITGQTLNAPPSGGFRAYFNIQIEDWDPQANGPLLNVWQTRVDGSGYLGANAVPPQSGCNIVPPVQACTSINPAGDAECAAAFGETGTPCTNGPPLRCEWGFFNHTRADWVHLAEEPHVVGGANISTTSVQFGMVILPPELGSADGGLLYYGATLVAEIPACALGQYTIPLVAADTLARDPDSNDIPILELVAAVVNIAPLPPECDSNDDCDDLDPCTTDTCELDMTCEHTPIPNCPPPSPGPAFTYQGFLEKPAGTPVNDTCDFRFGLWATAAGGNQVGASPQTIPDVEVNNGVFTVLLDFGAGTMDGDPRWLEIEVQCGVIPTFFLLAPRVEINPAPYAIRAMNGVGPPDTIEVDVATGYVGIGTTMPTHPLEMASGAHCTAGGVWTDASDRNAKENFISLDRGLVLEQLAGLEVVRWNYKVENPSVQHMGPVAQDFHALFGLGADDKHIASLDSAGVALAAIQGLYEIVQEKDCELGELREQKDHELDELRSEIAELKALVNKLAAQNGGGR